MLFPLVEAAKQYDVKSGNGKCLQEVFMTGSLWKQINEKWFINP